MPHIHVCRHHLFITVARTSQCGFVHEGVKSSDHGLGSQECCPYKAAHTMWSGNVIIITLPVSFHDNHIFTTC